MNKNFNIDTYLKNLELRKIFDKLYRINRSIMGKGFEESLNIINHYSKLNKTKVKSQTKVLDWIVPDEWNIDEAYIEENGKKIIDYNNHNLHLMNYSMPVNKILNYENLIKNLYYIKNIPNAIPYVTSYYKKDWGFCLTYNQFKKLNKKGKFKVKINSSFKKGNLIYSNNLIPGKTKKEILIYTYLCHPQMANHELSGPLCWLSLYDIIKKTGPHKYSYRFVIGSENIGSAAYLHYNKKKIKNIKAGFVLNLLGSGKEVFYKKSRLGNSLADKAAINVLKHSNYKFKIIDFTPEGSDERQFCSPGFNMPVGNLMRKVYRAFKQYHNSLDNEKFINFKTLNESIKIYYEILMTLENNFIPKAKIIYGTPQLSRSKVNLYESTMKSSGIGQKSKEIKLLLEILNLAEGKLDILDICLKKDYKLIDYIHLYKKLIKSKYIKEIL